MGNSNAVHSAEESLDFTYYQERHPHVFVSYAKEDKETVVADILQLRHRGVNVWYDEQLLVGENWKKQVRPKILSAAGVIFYASSYSLSSPQVMLELKCALTESSSKSVFPVNLLSETVKFSDYVRAHAHELELVISDLLDVLRILNDDVVYSKRVSTDTCLDEILFALLSRKSILPIDLRMFVTREYREMSRQYIKPQQPQSQYGASQAHMSPQPQYSSQPQEPQHMQGQSVAAANFIFLNTDAKPLSQPAEQHVTSASSAQSEVAIAPARTAANSKPDVSQYRAEPTRPVVASKPKLDEYRADPATPTASSNLSAVVFGETIKFNSWAEGYYQIVKRLIEHIENPALLGNVRQSVLTTDKSQTGENGKGLLMQVRPIEFADKTYYLGVHSSTAEKKRTIKHFIEALGYNEKAVQYSDDV